MKYYRHFPADYLRDTMDLTLEEDAAYRRLLDWQYLHEQPIRDLDHAYKVCRTRKGCTCVARVLHAFFHLQEDGYWNARFVKEQAHYLGITYKRRQAAFAKHLHARMSHNPDTRKKEARNTTSSQDHAVENSVENSAENFPASEEKSSEHKTAAPNGNASLAEQLRELNARLKIETDKELLRKRGLL